MFSTAGQFRHQLAELVNETEGGPPQPHALAVGGAVDAFTVEVHLTSVRREHAGQAVQQG
jgi:hypothetical protein